MRPIVQVAALGATAAAVACASLAGLEPSQSPTQDDASASEGGGNVDAIADASAADGDTDAPVCLPPKKANDLDCTKAEECCSDACNEDHKCHSSCQEENKPCNPIEGDQCCIGTYCSFRAPAPLRCQPCLNAGEQVETVPGTKRRITRSCCSGRVAGDQCL
jgi:hypothetical protein